MLHLRPLIVVTGTLKVEGGTAIKQHGGKAQDLGDRDKITVVQEREVTDDRRHANVMVLKYNRRLDALKLYKTPFGRVFDQKDLPKVKEVLDEVTREIRTFKSSSVVLTNCLLWEPLTGNRKAAMEGWLARQMEKDSEIAAMVTKELSIGGGDEVAADR